MFLPAPLQMYPVFCRSIYLEFARERGMRIPEAYQFDLLLHQWTPERAFNLRAPVIMPVNVTPHRGAGQEFHVVGSSKETDIIDLRDSRRKKLEGSGDQILGFPSSKGIEESAVYLV